MEISCETALELLSASLDGELTPDQEVLLQAHLDQCSSCRALQAELSGLHAACGEMEILPPAELKERIMANLPSQRPGKVIYWKRWGAMAAALALVALAAWRLPHSLYHDGSVPTTDTNDIQQAVSDPETASVTSGSVDEGLSAARTLNEMPLSVERDSLPAYDPDAPAPRSLPVAEVDTAGRAAKRSLPVEGTETAKEEDNDFTFAYAGGGETQPQDNTESLESVPPQSRIALFSAMPDPVYAVDPDDTDLVAEPDPLDGETPIAALPLETVTQDVRDFSRYSAVVVLTNGSFEGDYPRQRQENGDMWYLLPRSELERLPQTLSADATAYDLRLEGNDLTPDAPYVLLIVPSED